MNKNAEIVQRVGAFSLSNSHSCVGKMGHEIRNWNIFNCFRKFSELMPNLGLEMVFMQLEGSQVSSLNF